MSHPVSRKKEPMSLQLGRYDEEHKRAKSRERQQSLTETAKQAAQNGNQHPPSTRLSLKRRHTQELSQAGRHAALSRERIKQGRRKSDVPPPALSDAANRTNQVARKKITRTHSTTRLPSEKQKAPPEEIVILSRAARIRRDLADAAQNGSYQQDLNSTAPLKLPSAQELQKAKLDQTAKAVNRLAKPLKRSGSVPRNLPSEKGKKNSQQANDDPPPGAVIVGRAARSRLGLPALPRRGSFQNITPAVSQPVVNLNSTLPLKLPSAEKGPRNKSTAKKTHAVSKPLIRSGSVPRTLPSQKQAVFDRLSKSKPTQQAYEDPPPGAVILSRAARLRQGLPDVSKKRSETSLLRSPSTDQIDLNRTGTLEIPQPRPNNSMNETAILTDEILSLKPTEAAAKEAPLPIQRAKEPPPVISQLPLKDSILPPTRSSLIKKYTAGDPTVEGPSPNSSIIFDPQTRFPDDEKESDFEDKSSARLESTSPGRAKLIGRNNEHPYVLQFMMKIDKKCDWMNPEKDLVQHSHRITQEFNDEFNLRRKDILLEISELEKEIGQLTSELSLRMVELSTLNTELERLDPELTELHDQLEERYTELRKEHREFSIQIEKLETELKPRYEKIEAIGGDSFLVEGPSDWNRATEYLKAFDEPPLKAIFFPTVLELLQEAGYYENKSSQNLSCWDVYCTLLQERKAAQAITTLDCRNLKLKRLPPCIEKLQLPNLKFIYLDNNDFDEIPSFKSIAPTVRTISCNRNNILEVPQHLFVEHNSLTELNLAYQNANGRRMTRMPYKLSVGAQAEKEIIVDLRGNQITVEAHRFSETMRKFKFTFKMFGNPEGNLPRLTDSVNRSLEVGNITVTWRDEG